MKKRVLSAVLALVMCLSLCTPAFASLRSSEENQIQPRTGAVHRSSTPFYGTESSYTKLTSSRVASVALEEHTEQIAYDAMVAMIGAAVGGPVAAVISAGFSHFVFSVDTYNAIMHALGLGIIKTSYYARYTRYEPQTQPHIAEGITYSKLVVEYFIDSACTSPVGLTEITYEKVVVNMWN